MAKIFFESIRRTRRKWQNKTAGPDLDRRQKVRDRPGGGCALGPVAERWRPGHAVHGEDSREGNLFVRGRGKMVFGKVAGNCWILENSHRVSNAQT